MIQRILLQIRKITALNLSLIIMATLLVSGCTGCGAVYRAGSKTGSVADSGADNRAGSKTGSVADADAAFEEFCNELFRESLSESGLSTHIYLEHPENYGITDYPLTIGGYDIDGIGDTTHITDALTRLKAFPEEQLSCKNQLTYDELKMYLETELEYSDVCLYDTFSIQRPCCPIHIIDANVPGRLCWVNGHCHSALASNQCVRIGLFHFRIHVLYRYWSCKYQ